MSPWDLLEGKSLLDDATSFTLFTIFLSEVMDYPRGHILVSTLSNMLSLAVGASVSSKLDVVCRWGPNESATVVGGRESVE